MSQFDVPARCWQFSLLSLLAVMTGVAVFASLFQLDEDLLAAIGAIGGLSAFVAIWAVILWACAK